MTYSIEFNDSLTDSSSSYYKQFSARSTEDLLAIINTTSLLIADDGGFVWTFSEGSTIATSENVTVLGTDNVADAQQQIEESSANITNLTSIQVEGTYVITEFIVKF